MNTLKKTKVAILTGISTGIASVASIAFAAPTLTVPALDTASSFSAGDAVMVGLAAVLGITIAIRVFKKI